MTDWSSNVLDEDEPTNAVSKFLGTLEGIFPFMNSISLAEILYRRIIWPQNWKMYGP